MAGPPLEHSLQAGADADGPQHGERIGGRDAGEVATEPPRQRRVAGDLADLHEPLRVEVRAGGIGRAAGVNEEQVAGEIGRVQRRHGGREAEEAVEIDASRGCAAIGAGDGERGSGEVVVVVAPWHAHREAVGRAAKIDPDDGVAERRAVVAGDGDAGQTGRLNLSLTATLHF